MSGSRIVYSITSVRDCIREVRAERVSSGAAIASKRSTEPRVQWQAQKQVHW